MSVLRWGVLSTADIGRTKVIPAMQMARRSEVRAIASRDEATAAAVAAELGIPSAYGSYEALLADPQVDAVYIPLPNHLHREWTIASARAGKHVLCEKPLAMTSADAQEMVDACRASGVILMEAFMYRVHPSWLAVRETVASGRLGELRAVQSWFSYFNDDPRNIRNIREVGGGALYDVGCYCVSLSRLLFGAEPRSVKASLQREGDGVDVLTSAILEFDRGVATFTCSTRTETDQRVDIYGSRGRISVNIPFNIPPDSPTLVFIHEDAPGPGIAPSETLRFDTMNPYTAQAEHFAAVALDGAAPSVPITDAVANLRVIERIFAAGEAAGES